MLYISTRARSEQKVDEFTAIVEGLAPDGGLYVPERMPKIKDWKQYIGKDYQETAANVMAAFFEGHGKETIELITRRAYGPKFDDERICPVVAAGDYNFLELFHGPTLAFKDMALTVLPYLMTNAIKQSGKHEEIVILTATSGDTGKAALEGFSDIEGIRIIVFYPRDGVSRIQKQQMITQEGKNTMVVNIEGNFDDAQTGVKKIFADMDFAKKLQEKGYSLSSANSINIGRLVPQVAYYYGAYAQMVESGAIKDGDMLDFIVPTGNFGNILAGYYAKQMGLPVGNLICASNSNNVLEDFFKTGIYDRNRDFYKTISPSMDILVSSNLERLLYAVSDGDTGFVADCMTKLNSAGVYEVDENIKARLACFKFGHANDEETKTVINRIFVQTGYVCDTHTGVAAAVLEKVKRESSRKAVIISTASPFKFPRDVIAAIGSTDNAELPEEELLDKLSTLSGLEIPAPLSGIWDREILHKTSCSVEKMQQTIADNLILS